MLQSGDGQEPHREALARCHPTTESRVFTGIVQGQCELGSVDLSAGEAGQIGVRLTLALRESLKRGDSVAIDGTCLTVRELSTELVFFDVIKSSLARTLVGSYKAGDFVNVERSVTLGGEIGGHEVSGHVDTCAVVERIEKTKGNTCVFFRIDEKWARYVFPQGFIAINGASLTVSDRLESGTLFSAWLIPETLEVTNLGELCEGSRVNVEIHRGLQVVVDTIEQSVHRFLQQALEEGKLDADVLEKLGNLPRLLAARDSGDAS